MALQLQEEDMRENLKNSNQICCKMQSVSFLTIQGQGHLSRDFVNFNKTRTLFWVSINTNMSFGFLNLSLKLVIQLL